MTQPRQADDPAKQLQRIMARNGFWLDQDEAVRLVHEERHALAAEELVLQATASARPLTTDEKARLAPAFKDPPCPRCGQTDTEAPCTGDPSHGSKPLAYRHKGRVPPRRGNPRLDGSAVTQGGMWDTEAAHGR